MIEMCSSLFDFKESFSGVKIKKGEFLFSHLFPGFPIPSFSHLRGKSRPRKKEEEKIWKKPRKKNIPCDVGRNQHPHAAQCIAGPKRLPVQRAAHNDAHIAHALPSPSQVLLHPHLPARVFLPATPACCRFRR